eukprot:sb/3475933/
MRGPLSLHYLFQLYTSQGLNIKNTLNKTIKHHKQIIPQVNAVDSEFMMGLQKDSERLEAINVSLIQADHPCCIFASGNKKSLLKEPTEPSKQPIRTRYLGHVTGYQPMRDQYFLLIIQLNN